MTDTSFVLLLASDGETVATYKAYSSSLSSRLRNGNPVSLLCFCGQRFSIFPCIVLLLGKFKEVFLRNVWSSYLIFTILWIAIHPFLLGCQLLKGGIIAAYHITKIGTIRYQQMVQNVLIHLRLKHLYLQSAGSCLHCPYREHWNLFPSGVLGYLTSIKVFTKLCYK